MTLFYKQCKFTQRGENCVREQIAWIPEKFAIEGKIVKFKTKRGTWDNRWKVEEVYPLRRQYLLDPRQMIKGHRKATGDSLPRNNGKNTRDLG